MKKIFLFAAAIVAAVAVNAQTIDFPDVIAQADFGATRTFKNGGVELSINNGNNKFAVDANKAKFGTAEAYVQDSLRLKTGGASGSKSSMTLTVPADGTVTIHARTASGKVARTLVLSQNGLDILTANLIDEDAVSIKDIDDQGKESTISIYPLARLRKVR